jgi:hypothetical protein
LRRPVVATAIVAALLATIPSASLAHGPVALGVNGYGTLAAQTHVGWARVSIYWRLIQTTSDPDPAHWDWALADSVVNEAVANGQQVLFILSGSPVWATPGQSNGNGAYPPTNIQWDCPARC